MIRVGLKKGIALEMIVHCFGSFAIKIIKF